MTARTRERAADFYDRPHFVYRCFAADGELLYVGCTSNLDVRHASHRSQSSWFRRLSHVRLIGPFVGEDARRRALSVERQLIENDRPTFNTNYRDAGLKAWATKRRTMEAQHRIHGRCAYRCRDCRDQWHDVKAGA